MVFAATVYEPLTIKLMLISPQNRSEQAGINDGTAMNKLTLTSTAQYQVEV